MRELLQRAVVVFAAELERHRYTRIIIFREAHLHPEIHGRARATIAEATREIAAVLARGVDATADSAVLTAVAALVARSYLVDAILVDEHHPAAADPILLDLLAEACTRDPGTRT